MRARCCAPLLAALAAPAAALGRAELPAGAPRVGLLRGAGEDARGESSSRRLRQRGGATAAAAAAPPLASTEQQDPELVAVLAALWRSWPHTTKNLRTHTHWGRPRKTEWASQVAKRLLEKQLPLLGHKMKVHPELAAARDKWNRTALHYAAWSGVERFVPIFLAARGDPYQRDTMGHTALHKAAIRGFGNILKALMKDCPSKLRQELEEFCTGAGAPIGSDTYKDVFGREQRQPITDPVPVQSDAECPDGVKGGGWRMEEGDGGERCDIDRRSNLSPEEFHREYFLKGRPVILRRVVAANDLCHFDKENFKKLGLLDNKKRCGPTAYPSLTAQHHCLDGLYSLGDLDQANVNCTSDPAPYSPYCVFPPLSTNHEKHTTTLPYSLLPANVLNTDNPAFPPLATPAWKRTVRFQFFFGGTRSGAALHWHRDAYAALLAGEKTWFVVPPAATGLSGLPPEHWLRGLEIPTLPGGPFRCRQQRGDAVVLPAQWGHATQNHGLTLNIGNLWQTKHSKDAIGPRGRNLEDTAHSPFFHVVPALEESVNSSHNMELARMAGLRFRSLLRDKRQGRAEE
eukprot:TRINITY_DN59987_c0_g1_i1.p1 TRINITY_DN59987_c0_g1~~TRINITY_DN59987_c0_g1_i1.p1  ORF type:complete len:599 (+),score=133.08 TRINITY_DN59987_c0_g1_i1:82-1797(+)